MSAWSPAGEKPARYSFSLSELPVREGSLSKMNRASRFRTYSVDTDNDDEREPLLSSDNSRTSLGPPCCMFFDSETSDLEVSPMINKKWQPNKKRKLNCLYVMRKPYSEENLLLYKKLNQDKIQNIKNNLRYYRKSDFFKIDSQDDPSRPKTSSLVTIFSIWNTMVGTSLLAMPFGMDKSGLFGGLILIISMGILMTYTAYCNVGTYKRHGKTGTGDLFEICHDLLGPVAEWIAKIFSVLVLLGANIVYWVLMTNALYFLLYFIYYSAKGDPLMQVTWNKEVLCPEGKVNLTEVTAEDSTFATYWHLEHTVPIYMVFIVGPLLNFKSPTFFSKFTSLGTVSVMYIVLFSFMKSVSFGFHANLIDPASKYFTGWWEVDFPTMSGMLSLSFFIHNIIIPIMQNNADRSKNIRDLSIAYGLVIITYGFIGVSIFLTFPLDKSCIDDNIFNNFLPGDTLTLIGRVCLFFQLLTVYPLVAFMLRSQFMVMVFKKSYPSITKVVAFNAILIFLCVMTAVFVPKISVIIRYTGALSGFIHCFTVPCLLKMASQKLLGKLTIWSQIFHYSVAVLGFLNIIAQFFMKSD